MILSSTNIHAFPCIVLHCKVTFDTGILIYTESSIFGTLSLLLQGFLRKLFLLPFGILEWDKSSILWDLNSFLHEIGSPQMSFSSCVFAKWRWKIIRKRLSILSMCMPFFPNIVLEVIQFKGTLYSPCTALDSSSYPWMICFIWRDL